MRATNITLRGSVDATGEEAKEGVSGTGGQDIFRCFFLRIVGWLPTATRQQLTAYVYASRILYENLLCFSPVSFFGINDQVSSRLR